MIMSSQPIEMIQVFQGLNGYGVPVGGTCSLGDRACMLHVTDWALVVVR